MRDFNLTYIPDLTERFPEGFDGVDMFEPRDPEYEFWKTVEEAERAEREDEPEPNYWVSYYTWGGSQCGASVYVPEGADAYKVIDEYLKEVIGRDYGEINDYGSYDDLPFEFDAEA